MFEENNVISDTILMENIEVLNFSMRSGYVYDTIGWIQDQIDSKLLEKDVKLI